MAELVNGITHLLAGERWHWSTLDALHLQLHARLVANAQQPSAFVALRDQIDSTLNELLVFTAGTSEAARGYYLARAEEHSAPTGCGMLYVAAATAHCDGKCGATDATQMQIASFPYAGSPSAEGLAELSDSRVRRAAMQAACSPHGPGSGSMGCSCRVALLENLSGSAKWPSALLDSTPSAAPIELAAQQASSLRRRCVIAQVCGPDSTAASPNGICLLTKWHEEDQHRGVYLHVDAEQKPCRKQFILGYAPQSSVALAKLSATAQEWVHGEGAWQGRSGSEVRYKQMLDHTFEAGDELGAWGCSRAMLKETLERFGYAKPAADGVLVYAAVEVVGM